MKLKLTKEEKAIVESFEAGEWKIIGKSAERRIRKIIKAIRDARLKKAKKKSK